MSSSRFHRGTYDSFWQWIRAVLARWFICWWRGHDIERLEGVRGELWACRRCDTWGRAGGFNPNG